MDSLEAFLQPESIILDFVRVQNYLNRLYVIAPQKIAESIKKEQFETADFDETHQLITRNSISHINLQFTQKSTANPSITQPKSPSDSSETFTHAPLKAEITTPTTTTIPPSWTSNSLLYKTETSEDSTQIAVTKVTEETRTLVNENSESCKDPLFYKDNLRKNKGNPANYDKQQQITATVIEKEDFIDISSKYIEEHSLNCYGKLFVVWDETTTLWDKRISYERDFNSGIGHMKNGFVQPSQTRRSHAVRRTEGTNNRNRRKSVKYTRAMTRQATKIKQNQIPDLEKQIREALLQLSLRSGDVVHICDASDVQQMLKTQHNDNFNKNHSSPNVKRKTQSSKRDKSQESPLQSPNLSRKVFQQQSDLNSDPANPNMTIYIRNLMNDKFQHFQINETSKNIKTYADLVNKLEDAEFIKFGLYKFEVNVLRTVMNRYALCQQRYNDIGADPDIALPFENMIEKLLTIIQVKSRMIETLEYDEKFFEVSVSKLDSNYEKFGNFGNGEDSYETDNNTITIDGIGILRDFEVDIQELASHSATSKIFDTSKQIRLRTQACLYGLIHPFIWIGILFGYFINILTLRKNYWPNWFLSKFSFTCFTVAIWSEFWVQICLFTLIVTYFVTAPCARCLAIFDRCNFRQFLFRECQQAKMCFRTVKKVDGGIGGKAIFGTSCKLDPHVTWFLHSFAVLLQCV